MQREYIKCKCNNIYLDSDFTSHFPRCNEFKISFREFDTEFGKLLKTYSEPKENLLIIRVLLEQYRIVLDSKIKNSGISFAPYGNFIFFIIGDSLNKRENGQLGGGSKSKPNIIIKVINIKQENPHNDIPNKIEFKHQRIEDIQMDDDVLYKISI